MNLIEGAQDKSDSGLREILYAQAKIRLLVAIPVIVINLVLFLLHSPAGIPGWLLWLIASYAAYALSPYVLIRRAVSSELQFLLLATAVGDPLMLSVWIALTGVYGSVIGGFYLFTMLGFGFRTGRVLMHVCQVASLGGFAIVLAVSRFWQENLIIWTALVIPMIVVPMYGSTLIKTLRKARDEAEEQSRAKSDLLAKVSHELRTPLTGIVASAELLLAEFQDPHVVGRTNTILRLSDNLLCEINDLLDEAKFDASAIALICAPLDLREQITALRATFESMAIKKGLTFQANLDPAIGDAVEADAHQLDRVLLNLVSNGIKFTDRGSVTLAVELLRATPQGYHLRFSVTDTGIGIPESFRAKIFERFSQVDQGPSRRYGGTGLGLALSKKIVDLMGGELRYESNLDAGSHFWFELVLRRVAAPSDALTVSSVAHHEIVVGKRILVVDDNASNLVLLKELLEIDRHHVTACTSGMSALEVLTQREFDLLLLDYNLADMDGVRVMQTYRFGRLNPAPVLFLTADATVQTAKRLRDAGGAGILYKPVSLASIRQEIAGTGLRVDAPVTRDSPPTTEITAISESRPALKSPALTIVPINPLNETTVAGLQKISSDPRFFLCLLEQTKGDIAKCVEQLLDALSRRNFAAVRSAAHALKGVSSNVGAVRLVAMTTALMSLPSAELESSAERLSLDFRESTQAAEQALDRLISTAQDDLSSGRNGGVLHRD